MIELFSLLSETKENTGVLPAGGATVLPLALTPAPVLLVDIELFSVIAGCLLFCCFLKSGFMLLTLSSTAYVLDFLQNQQAYA